MRELSTLKVLVGITGGIAAYKVAHLVRDLTKKGAEVRVVMTESACQFISPATFQGLSGHPVSTQLWNETTHHGMDHIQLARWADVFLIAPASAHTIAKLAQGLADNLLTTLALVTEAPIMICPAMNQSMYRHPATQSNLRTLQQRGVIIIPPEDGEAACGETGTGRLCEPHHLLALVQLFPLQGLLTGQHVVITAGPTREALDPVRYLSNESSGKMGYALAYAAWMAGAQVTLISGPTALLPPPHVRYIPIQTAQEMLHASIEHITADSIFICAAAIADYTFAQRAEKKLKKDQARKLSLDLVPTEDLLQFIQNHHRPRYTVGFAAETDQVMEYAQKKRLKKNLDLIIANQVGPNLGFNQDSHSVTLMHDQGILPLSHQPKIQLACTIIKFISSQLPNRKD
jgi:phosphopantothenoylcysteine decarboxylase/phosphopantothenate--cysteine ligase